MRIPDVVIAAQSFVWTESLVLHCGKCGLNDVGTWNVPARREAGLIKDERPFGIGNNAVTVADHEASGSLADVDAVVTIGRVAYDPFVFFVEGVHRWPRKCHPGPKLAGIARQVDVLPCPARDAV